MAGSYDDWGESPDDDYDEVVGSCDNCECDVYEGEDYDYHGLLLCSQCCWHAMVLNGERKP